MLEDVEDIIVCPPQKLLENLIDTVRSEPSAAVENKEPLLSLIFGHGYDETKAVFVGEPLSADLPTNLSYQLQRSDLGSVLGPQVQATLPTTACSGGGWAITANVNAWTLTGANEDEPTLSWQVSNSMSRCCGRRFTTSVVEALVRFNVPDALNSKLVPSSEDAYAYESFIPLPDEFEKGGEPPSYA
jgi:hypothetical protein